MNLKAIYENMKGDRQPFLADAQRLADLSIPRLNPDGNQPSHEQKRTQVYSHKGAMAFRSLAASNVKTLMPPGVAYFKLDLPGHTWQTLDEQAASGEIDAQIPDTIRRRIQWRTRNIIRSLESKNVSGKLAPAIRRNLIEGTTLLINEPTALRVMPLRSFCADWHGGKPRIIAMKECITADPIATEGERTADRDYYRVIQFPWTNPYTGKKEYDGGVWWSDESGEAKVRKEDSPSHYILMVTEIPEEDDYTHGYGFDFIRLLAQINHASKSLGEAMALAAWNRPLARPGSTIAKAIDDYFGGKSGEPFIGVADDLTYPNTHTKLGDWSFVHQILSQLGQDLAQLFAMGIKDRSSVAQDSATAVLEIIDELGTQLLDLTSTLEQTMLRPLIMSEYEYHEQIEPLFDSIDISEQLSITITTGTNAIKKQQVLMQFVTQVLTVLANLDPTFRVNAGRVAEVVKNAMQIQEEDLWTIQAQQPTMMPEQMQGVPTEEMPRQETIMTAGGPQPPQPPQPGVM